MKLKNAYEKASALLSEANIDEAQFKALCIVCHASEIKNSSFFAHAEDETDFDKIDSLLSRIIKGEPLQYVIGFWDFYESVFKVGEGVLIPRPETEELVELALDSAKKLKAPVIFDLCAGSGCIGISLAKKLADSTVYCIEKSEKAYYYLSENAKDCENVRCICGDIISGEFDLPCADIIVSNPPYIKSGEISSLQNEVLFEPVMALDGGDDGLTFYRVINERWHSRLKEGGLLLLEIGNEQGDDVKSLLTNFKDIRVIKDIYGNDRMVSAVRR